MDDAREDGKLNPSQRLHLLSSCQYADKLLAEIEAVLSDAQSKSPFPKFQPDISPAQAKIVQDYISRMRAQIVRILESQGVPIPGPGIGALHSIRVTLGFVDIAFDECRPERMAGYGRVPDAARTEVAGLVDEMQGIISKLDRYLAQGQAADLAQRLQRLQEAGSDIGVIKTLERIIDRHGLVEFRPALATVIDRLESRSFEIAVFGRVSSGKSSLLNHIVGQDVLPVGVNPITAVPTRLTYGAAPRATAWFADRKPEHFGIEQLAEFVTEQHNPSNIRHVTRIVVELPAPRLREGVVYVDTPGLGSLATSGAAETKAYLPRCDLGVVLVDSGSTLTEDDLATIQTLYEAGIPAGVVLSKADLLAPADLGRAVEYVAEHIRKDLGLVLPVEPVSIKPGYAGLLENWLSSQILPLYDRHAELAQQSVNRKIGALRVGVEAALASRLSRHAGSASVPHATLREMETDLRTAAGKIAEARARCIEMSDELRNSGAELAASAAKAIAAVFASGEVSEGDKVSIKPKLEQAAAERAARIAFEINAAALQAGNVLAKVAAGLQVENRPDTNELSGVVVNMPRFDLGSLNINLSPSALAAIFGRGWQVRRLQRQIQTASGPLIDEAVSTYGRVVQSWVRKTFTDLQERFDTYADAYRAQLGRLLSSETAESGDEQAVREDLSALSGRAWPEAPAISPERVLAL